MTRAEVEALLAAASARAEAVDALYRDGAPSCGREADALAKSAADVPALCAALRAEMARGDRLESAVGVERDAVDRAEKRASAAERKAGT